MTDEPTLKIKVQLFCGDEIAMGPGKADLIDAIVEHGSISAAGRAMGMSYSRAWKLVDVMNRCWSAPLIETMPGRRSGGGAMVTELGRAVLAGYRDLQEQLDRASAGASLSSLRKAIRTVPLPQQTLRS